MPASSVPSELTSKLPRSKLPKSKLPVSSVVKSAAAHPHGVGQRLELLGSLSSSRMAIPTAAATAAARAGSDLSTAGSRALWRDRPAGPAADLFADRGRMIGANEQERLLGEQAARDQRRADQLGDEAQAAAPQSLLARLTTPANSPPSACAARTMSRTARASSGASGGSRTMRRCGTFLTPTRPGFSSPRCEDALAQQPAAASP